MLASKVSAREGVQVRILPGGLVTTLDTLRSPEYPPVPPGITSLADLPSRGWGS